jgi:hypothetical protein
MLFVQGCTRRGFKGVDGTMQEKLQPPDESFLVDAGRRIKLTSSREAHRLLDEACAAYKRCTDEFRKTGNLRNLTLARFENCERRLRSYLLNREVKKTERAIRRGKQA